MNALTPPLFDALIAAGEALARDDSVRAVVLHGNGRAFCAGLDLSNFDRVRDPDSRIAPGRLAARTHGDANDFQQAVLVWQSLPVPVIAAVHGV
ncbi:enoyl-CoA hydratase-related protein, partial [Acinetobacter baumannii]